MTWAAVVSGVASVAGAYISSQGSSDNPNIPKLERSRRLGTPDNIPDPKFVDIFGVARRTNEFNTQTGIPDAREQAQQINAEQAAQFESLLAQLFGGEEALREQQGLVNQATEAQLRGEVAPGTRNQLGRAALSNNLTELGPAAVGTAFTGFLGLTAEQQVQQGQNQFRSLYALYGSFVPRADPGALLPFTGISSGQAIQGELQNAQFANQFSLTEFNALQQLDQLALQENLAAQGVGADIARVNARNPNASLYGALGAAVSTYGGQAASNFFGSSTRSGGFATAGGGQASSLQAARVGDSIALARSS